MFRTSSPTRLLVFAKAPEPGVVKTRLIPVLGAQGAAALHARLLKHTLAVAKQASLGTLELHGAPAADPFLAYCAARYDAALIDQCEGDLGTRLGSALDRALQTGGTAIVIGSDCPALTARHLRQAAAALAGGDDAVLIPAEDGGYALLGLARCDERLFTDIAWSTGAVLDQTRARLKALDWRWTELETLWDVDTPEDLERLTASGLLEKNAHRRV